VGNFLQPLKFGVTVASFYGLSNWPESIKISEIIKAMVVKGLPEYMRVAPIRITRL